MSPVTIIVPKSKDLSVTYYRLKTGLEHVLGYQISRPRWPLPTLPWCHGFVDRMRQQLTQEGQEGQISCPCDYFPVAGSKILWRTLPAAPYMSASEGGDAVAKGSIPLIHHYEAR